MENPGVKQNDLGNCLNFHLMKIYLTVTSAMKNQADPILKYTFSLTFKSTEYRKFKCISSVVIRLSFTTSSFFPIVLIEKVKYPQRRQ